jgi:predicted transposase/invertase (TIGR01784 family)
MKGEIFRMEESGQYENGCGILPGVSGAADAGAGLGRNRRGGAPYAFHSEEIKQTAFRLDGVLLPVNAPDAPVVIVEVQYQPDDELYGRLFAELFLYLYRATPPRNWRVIVIYPDRSVERLDERYASLLTLPEVHRVYLEDWRGRPAHTLEQALLQLLIIEPATLEPAATSLAQRLRASGAPGALPVTQWLDLIETILVYR